MMRSILRGARTMRTRRPGELLKVAVVARGEIESEGDAVYSNILLAAHNKTQTDKNLSGFASPWRRSLWVCNALMLSGPVTLPVIIIFIANVGAICV